MSKTSTERVELAKVGRPHGVYGDVRLYLFNADSEILEEGLTVYVRTERQVHELKIERYRQGPKFAMVKFKGIQGREGAESIKHGIVEVDFDLLPELDDDEFYLIEAIGYPVYVAAEEDGDPAADAPAIGTIDRFFETGANDVLVVKRHDGSELFVPYVEHAVSYVDVEAPAVVLQPLEIWTPADE
ncbi:16S rRNA processing protein RimM [Lujinxingia litoralis]|uniref:Ribosome maturation factor RimM n=1 Tax=Lujinxingia litoralis TaxID=2211119 RepID=A0A328CAW3_9DELT|nr:ribosome maturation factor RimM [Lujinxingia litoralis]RAL22903.1 16S rRNA processing protein RimM [Lujinxingia litoralis]